MTRRKQYRCQKNRDRSEHFRRNDSDRVIIQLRNFEVFFVYPENVISALIYFRVIHDFIPGEEHIIGVEWLAIAPIDPAPQIKRPGLLVGLDRPGLSQP